MVRMTPDFRMMVLSPQYPTVQYTFFENSVHLSIWKRLKERKWAVGELKESLRIVILPHIEREHVDAFLTDLQAILGELRR